MSVYTRDFFITLKDKYPGNLSLEYINEFIGKISVKKHFHGKSNRREIYLRKNKITLSNRADNAFVPTQIKPKKDINADDIAVKMIVSILNKITPKTFEKLSKNILKHIDWSMDRTVRIVTEIFNKALDEPNFSETYAKLCLTIIINNKKDIAVNFRILLVKKCQDEFGRIDDRIKELQKSPTNKLLLDNEEERKYAKAKRHLLGNIKFIGELFKLDILPVKVIHLCIKQILMDVESISDELGDCISIFFKTIGKKLDTNNRNDIIESYYKKIQYLSSYSNHDSEISGRIKFKLFDVISLRKKKWIKKQKV